MYNFQTIAFSRFGTLGSPKRFSSAFTNVPLPTLTVNPYTEFFFQSLKLSCNPEFAQK
jgi:hypothetical protein